MPDIVPIEDLPKEAIKSLGEETVKQVFGFIGDITRPPSKELGGLFADHIRFWRFKTQIKIVKKAIQLLEDQELQTQKVPLKILAPMLEHCSWEEDDDMQKKWASLLANAATQDTKLDNFSTYVELLRQLTPNQARFLDIIYNHDESPYPARLLRRTISDYHYKERIKNFLSISNEEYQVTCDSLIRLNVIQPKTMVDDRDSSSRQLIVSPSMVDFSGVKINRSNDEVSLTHLGMQLVKKCRIQISEKQYSKIKKVLSKFADDLLRIQSNDGYSELIQQILSETQLVYEYINKAAISVSINSVLSSAPFDNKAASIDKSIEFPLNDNLKNQFINKVIDYLKLIYN